MKKYAILISIFISIGFVRAEKVVVHVPGMVCQLCVQGMQKGFKDYVNDKEKDIVVNLSKKIVDLNLKKSITDQQIKEIVKGTGYNVKKIDRKK